MVLSTEKSPLLVQSSDSTTINSDIGRGAEERPESADNQRSNLRLSTDTTLTNSEIRNTGITNMTVIALAFTVFVQSYLLEGVFPYAGFLTMHLLSSEIDGNEHSDVNEETVGKYAGYVACSFMAGRTITAVLWGRLADAYGRVFVLKVSLIASAITSLGFGFASTYQEALLWRFLMGLGNGITGTIKCLLSEIKESTGSEAKETKTMAIVYGMRGYGFLICPAITGFLSDPMKQYPRALASTITPLCVQSLLLVYPFVLPNLLAFFLCCGAFRLVRDNVEETLPEERRQPFSLFHVSKIGYCRKFGQAKGNKNFDNSEEVVKSETNALALSAGTNEKIEINKNETITSKNAQTTANYTRSADLLWYDSGKKSFGTDEQHLQRRRVLGRWLHLYVYWMFSFLNIASDELFPLFCLSKFSGLGIMENQISLVLGGTTIIYGVFQYFLLTGLVKNLGLYPTLQIGTFGSVPPTILIPIGSLWLATSTNIGSDSVVDSYLEGDGKLEQKDKLTPLVTIFLCVIIAATKSFCSVAFSTITMATNRTVDTIDQRATLNGIASFGGSFAKACGPVFAGTLFSAIAGDEAVFQRYAIEPPYGSIVTYGILSILGFLLGVQTIFLRGN